MQETPDVHNMHNTINDLELAITGMRRLLAAVGPEQWALPTPCTEWNVRTVANHVVGGMRLYAAELTGADPGGEHDDDWLGADPIGAYDDAARTVLAAWRRPGVRDRLVRLSFGAVPAPMAAIIELTELVVHGLDIALATGQEEDVDQAQARRLHAVMAAIGIDGFRMPGIFGPARSAAPDAPASRRLLAFLGRDIAVPVCSPA
jgi:uncharacterized protein (TIGR03086 family)